MSRTKSNNSQSFLNIPQISLSEPEPIRKRLAVSHGEPLLLERGFPTTMQQVLQQAAIHSSNKGIIYIEESDGKQSVQFYPALLEEAQRILGGLRKIGLKPQDKVILQISKNQDFIAAIWGCWLGGFVPIPIAIAPTYSEFNGTVSKLHHAWQMFDRPIILTNQKLTASIRSLSGLWKIENLCVETIEALRSSPSDKNWHNSHPDDLTLLLLTSGSTGMPKAVMHSHRSLLSRCVSTVQMNNFNSEDMTLNWMPLDHVGGLVMFHLRDVYLGCQQIHIAKEIILQNPLLWLDSIEQNQATVTWAPNFAYGLINNHAIEIQKRRWNLSSMRFILNAGETIVVKTARRFLELLSPHGLPITAIRPAWGMSETASAVTFSDRFSLDSITDNDSFVEVGRPIPGISIRIVDDNDRVVEEETIGRLQIKGASVTSGYYQNQEFNREVFTNGGWFNTGDLGFISQGKLTLTGRAKDAIIVNGINYNGHEIEAVVEEVEEVNVSYTAACAFRTPDSNSDELAIFFSPSISETSSLQHLLKDIRFHILKRIGINPTYLIPLEKEAIPKTEIGKIQRSQLSQRFLAGEFSNILHQFNAPKLQSARCIPKTELEKTVGSIWKQVLHLDEIGIHDNFFELGGNSLLIAEVASKLKEGFHRELSLIEMFQHPTIHLLAKYLGTGSNPKIVLELMACKQRGKTRRQKLIGMQVAG